MWFRHVVIVVAAGAAVAACNRQGDPAAERSRRAQRSEGDVVVGVAWPWKAYPSTAFGRGIDLARDEVNATGGIQGRPLRLVRADDQESVNEGRLIAQRFVRDPDVVAVIGHLQSYVTVPAAAVYDLGGVVMIAPTSTDPSLTARQFPRVFRTIFTDRDIGKRLAEIAVADGHRRAGILYIRNDYGRGLANSFEETAAELGLVVADRQSYDPGAASDRSLGAIVGEWRQRSLDVILVAGEPGPSAQFIRLLRDAGIGAAILGGDALSTPEFLERSGAAAEGAILATAYHPDDTRPGARAFRDAYVRRYQSPPDALAALGYDAVHVLVAAMRAARSVDPARVADQLHKAGSTWEGATGSLEFDAAGDPVNRAIVGVQVRGGAFAYRGLMGPRQVAVSSRDTPP
jgi:branched-chain amino acid transport system substrate-binding protein